MENVSTRFHWFEIPLRAALKRGVLNSINFPFVTLRAGGCVCCMKELVHHFVDEINSSSSREVRTDSSRSPATPHLFRKSFSQEKETVLDWKWKKKNSERDFGGNAVQEAQFCQKIVFRISRNFKTIKSTIIQILKFKNRTHSLKFWGRNIGMWKIFHRKRAHTFPGSEQITWKIPLEINFEQRQICRNRQQVDPPPLAVPKQHNGSIQGISFWGRKKNLSKVEGSSWSISGTAIFIYSGQWEERDLVPDISAL